MTTRREDEEFDDVEFDDEGFEEEGEYDEEYEDEEGFDEDEDGATEESPGNRLFVILAVGLVGLVILGLVAIGGVLVLRNMNQPDVLAEITPTISSEEVAPPTETPIVEESQPIDEAVTPTVTNTPIGMGAESGSVGVSSSPDESTSAGTEPSAPESGAGPATVIDPTATPQLISVAIQPPPPTPTPQPARPARPVQVPNTGIGILGFALIGVGLVTVLLAVRSLRTIR